MKTLILSLSVGLACFQIPGEEANPGASTLDGRPNVYWRENQWQIYRDGCWIPWENSNDAVTGQTPDRRREPAEDRRGRSRHGVRRGGPEGQPGPPNTGIGEPNASIGQPNVGIGQPNVGIGQPNVGIGQPNVGIGQPNVGIGQPNVGIGQHNVEIGQPTIGIGQPNLGIGQPNVGIGEPTIAMGQPTIGIGKPASGMGPPNIGIGPPTMPPPPKPAWGNSGDDQRHEDHEKPSPHRRR